MISLRSAAADLLARNGKWDTALALAPSHAGFFMGRGSGGDAERAALLGPAAAAPWIEMGLAAEMRGDFEQAERRLGEAVRRDRTFTPLWTLANYHFRRENWPEFWRTAREASSIYEGDLTGLYRLCLRTGASGGEVYQRVVPERSKARREFVQLMIEENRIRDAATAALALAETGHTKDKDLLFGYCDKLLENGMVDSAVELWRALPRFGPAAGHCFDWKYEPAGGVSLLRVSDSSARLELSGRQADQLTLLRRYLVVKPGHRYRLHYRVQASDDLRRGVRWIWNGETAGTLENEMVEVRAGDDKLAELRLEAWRPAGARRPDGVVEVDRIALDPVVVE